MLISAIILKYNNISFLFRCDNDDVTMICWLVDLFTYFFIN